MPIRERMATQKVAATVYPGDTTAFASPSNMRRHWEISGGAFEVPPSRGEALDEGPDLVSDSCTESASASSSSSENEYG